MEPDLVRMSVARALPKGDRINPGLEYHLVAEYLTAVDFVEQNAAVTLRVKLFERRQVVLQSLAIDDQSPGVPPQADGLAGLPGLALPLQQQRHESQSPVLRGSFELPLPLQDLGVTAKRAQGALELLLQYLRMAGGVDVQLTGLRPIDELVKLVCANAARCDQGVPRRVVRHLAHGPEFVNGFQRDEVVLTCITPRGKENRPQLSPRGGGHRTSPGTLESHRR